MKYIIVFVYSYTSDLDFFFFFLPEGKGTKVVFDGSDKPRLASHTLTKVHLNKRNISQPERMIQFEFPYTHTTLVAPRTPNPDLWMLGWRPSPSPPPPPPCKKE